MPETYIIAACVPSFRPSFRRYRLCARKTWLVKVNSGPNGNQVQCPRPPSLPPLTRLRLLTSLSAVRFDQTTTHQGGSEKQSLATEEDRHRNGFLFWMFLFLLHYFYTGLPSFSLLLSLSHTPLSFSPSLSVCLSVSVSVRLSLITPLTWRTLELHLFIFSSLACARLWR